MKKLNLQVVTLFFASLLLLLSCSDSNKQNRQVDYTFGIVRYDSPSNKLLLDVSNSDSFYSIRFATAMDDDCFWVNFEIDFDDAENSNAKVAANGYYTVNIIEKTDVDKWVMSSSLTDISETVSDEVAILDPMWNGDYANIKGKLCMFNIIEIPTDQNMNWHMSYDIDNLSSEEDGQKSYDVYLRATIRRAGVKSIEKVSIPNVFDMNDYLKMVANKEKELGKTAFRLRIHYPSAISEDGQITWKSKNSMEIYVAEIIL